MAIADKNDNTSRYQMTELAIAQQRIKNESEDPSYTLSFVMERYTVDVNNDRTYTGEKTKHYSLEFYDEAIAAYMVGDMTHVNSLGAVELTIVKFLNEDHALDVEVV